MIPAGMFASLSRPAIGLAALVGFFAATARADIASDLIGHWPFDEGVGVITDNLGSLGGASNGTLNGGVTFVPGRIGSHALSFDGTGHVDIGASATGPLTLVNADYTIAFWANHTSGMRFIVADDGSDHSGGYAISNLGGLFITHNYGPGTNLATGIAAAGEWKHYAVTYVKATNEVSVYVNASKKYSATVGGPLTSDGNDSLRFGAGAFDVYNPPQGEPAWGFQGSTTMMDDVRIYNRALNSAAVIDLCALGGGPCGDPPPQEAGPPIAYWSFNEAGDQNDAIDSVGGRNAALSGNATRGAGPAGFGRALVLDGSAGSHADVGYHAALSLAGTSYSIAWWAKADAQSGATQRMINMDSGNDNNGGYSLAIFPNQTSLGVQHGAGGTGNTLFSSNAAIPFGEWAHFAVTYDAETKTRSIYLNGDLLQTGGISGDITDRGSDPLRFGAMPVWNQNFRGALDEIRLYHGVLSGAQVRALLVPEPSSLALVVLGVVGVAAASLRRRRAAMTKRHAETVEA
jgi:hypothetical protein